MKEIQYEIVKEIAVLSKGDSGYTKEINLMADTVISCVPHTALKRGTCSTLSSPTSTDLRIWQSMMKRQ